MSNLKMKNEELTSPLPTKNSGRNSSTAGKQKKGVLDKSDKPPLVVVPTEEQANAKVKELDKLLSDYDYNTQKRLRNEKKTQEVVHQIKTEKIYSVLGYKSMRSFLIDKYSDNQYPYLSRLIRAAEISIQLGASVGTIRERVIRDLAMAKTSKELITRTAKIVKDVAGNNDVNEKIVIEAISKAVAEEVVAKKKVAKISAKERADARAAKKKAYAKTAKKKADARAAKKKAGDEKVARDKEEAIKSLTPEGAASHALQLIKREFPDRSDQCLGFIMSNMILEISSDNAIRQQMLAPA
jgi:hypothetical protein